MFPSEELNDKFHAQVHKIEASKDGYFLGKLKTEFVNKINTSSPTLRVAQYDQLSWLITNEWMPLIRNAFSDQWNAERLLNLSQHFPFEQAASSLGISLPKENCIENADAMIECAKAINKILFSKNQMIISRYVTNSDEYNNFLKGDELNVWGYITHITISKKAQDSFNRLSNNIREATINGLMDGKFSEAANYHFGTKLGNQARQQLTLKFNLPELVVLLDEIFENKSSNFNWGRFAIDRVLVSQHHDHSSLSLKKKMKDQRDSEINDEFIGIGVEIKQDQETGLIYLWSVLAGSGAEDCGLLKNDVITQIDEHTLTKSDRVSELVFNRLRGEEGTTVRLSVLRKGMIIDDINVVRKKVQIKTVVSEKMKISDQSFGYIRIHNFYQDASVSLVREALLEFEKDSEIDSYILDLRGNPGGIIQNAALIGGFFTGPNKPFAIFHPINKSVSMREYYQTPETSEKLTNRPVTILVNATSASASEILAIFLASQNSSLIVGEVTAGKATGLVPVNYISPSGVKIDNIEKFITVKIMSNAEGESHHLYGLTPHFLVDLDHPFAGSSIERLHETAVNPVQWKKSFSPFVPSSEYTECVETETIAEDYFGDASILYAQDRQFLKAVEVNRCQIKLKPSN